MSEYNYKIELSEESEKALRNFHNQIDAEICHMVKELKEKGYTDREITFGLNIALKAMTAKLFHGGTCKPGGIVPEGFVPEIKVVDGVPVCVNGNPKEVVIDTNELKKAFGL